MKDESYTWEKDFEGKSLTDCYELIDDYCRHKKIHDYLIYNYYKAQDSEQMTYLGCIECKVKLTLWEHVKEFLR